MVKKAWEKLFKRRFSNNISYLLALVGFIFLGFTTFYIYEGFKSDTPDPANLLSLMLASLVVFLFLGIFLIKNRVISPFTFIKREQHRASKLSKRILIAFSLGSAVPTIIVAVFSTYFFNFGIQSWFDEKISRVLDQSIIVGESYIAEHILQLKETAISVSDDLSEMYYDLIHNPEIFIKVLNAQAEMRSLDEAIVFQKNSNTIIAHTALSFSLSFATIPSHLMEKADNGEVVQIESDPTKIRILIKLNEYNDTYLLIGRLIDTKIIEHINKASGTAQEYFKLKKQISSLQIKFSMVFILLAVILLLSAIIWGRRFAELIVRPIRELVIAAEKVKNGDLSVQVPEAELKKDELKVLSSAFNRMIKQIDRQQKELVVAQRSLAWSDVARRVAHEIKNPLTPIQLSAERLVKKFKGEVSDPDAFEKYIKNILSHSNDIKMIVSEFVNFARLSAPHFSSCEIISLIHDLVEARKLINERVEYKFVSNMKIFDFVCDISQINQVMVNLLQNAEEAFSSFDQNKKIEVTILIEDDLVKITISDNGSGFPDKIIGSATQAYITTKHHGTGLGLAIVERIVQDHFGSIEIFNRKEGGATIRLIFNTKELKSKVK